MDFLEKLFSDPIFKHLKENEDLIGSELEKNYGETDDTETVVNDYFMLLKHLCKNKKPPVVKLNSEDSYTIIADGVVYDLDASVKHNDLKNTELKMEIESLLCDGVSVSEVEKRLNLKIKNEW